MRAAETLGHELLDKIDVTINGDRPWDLQVHNNQLWDRVIRGRELGFGEAYQDGWWDAEAPDQLITRILCADLQRELTGSRELLLLAAKARLQNRQSLRRAKANASAHYDIGNELYERMLDKRMIYSCGYWKNASDLDTAQEDKLDLICRKLALEPGMKLLDIGCGWGGFAQFAAERYDVHVTAISPAIEQVRLARQRCEGLKVDVKQLDYRQVTGSYDRIVSVGMLEHVGAGNYKTFFEKNDELLAPGGQVLHHTIGSLERKATTDPWFDKYIFPGGVLPSFSQLADASEKRWVIEDVHNFGPDYDRTLMAWHSRIEATWHELPHFDERFRRTWRYYLLSSAAGFRSRSLQLWQIVFRRSKEVAPDYQPIR